MDVSSDSTENLFDVIVIGGGCAAAHVAAPLVQNGKRVLMLDGGQLPTISPDLAPDDHFESIRSRNREQDRWFLGSNLSGISIQDFREGLASGNLTGNRDFVIRYAHQLLPTTSDRIQIVQSLAKGGLGAAWGGACAFLSSQELTKMGLPAEAFKKHYDIVSRRIGISGPPEPYSVQPPARLDHHGRALMSRYQKKQDYFQKTGLTLTQSHLALLTQDLGQRRATDYTDMEYFCDPNRSVYRPQFTIEELEKQPHFYYRGQMLVECVKSIPGGVSVSGFSIEQGKTNVAFSFTAHRIVLASGAIGTARILLRSFPSLNQKTSFIAKSHTLIACLNLSMVGQPGDHRRTSLCQLYLQDTPTNNMLPELCAQLYSYRSPLLCRLLQSLPLPTPESMRILASLVPSLVFADVRSPSHRDTDQWLSLKQNNHPNHYSTHIHGNSDETIDYLILKKVKKALRKLGLWPLKSVSMAPGSTFHYAGTVPIRDVETERSLSADSSGRLTQEQKIFIADASLFRFLPARPHTLTLMANANRIGEIICNQLP